MSPNGGDYIAQGKCVHRKVESEGNRQNIWPAGQKLNIRHMTEGKVV